MDELRSGLVLGARDVLVSCSAGVWRYPTLLPDGILWWPEPSHIASFVRYGVEALADAWTPSLDQAGVSLRITGVFCHQSPKVDMLASSGFRPPAGECELGDLLIVHEHGTGTARRRRAMLLQAKMATEGSVPKNGPQEFLYEHWPDFSITKPRVFDRRSRNLRDNATGGKYVLIDDPPWGRAPWTLHPGNLIGPSEPFAETLVRMLDYDGLADRGRPAEAIGDEWTDLVEELLKQLRIRTFAEKGLLGPGIRANRVNVRSVGNSRYAYLPDPTTAAFYVSTGSSAAISGGASGGGGDLEDSDEFDPAGNVILIQTAPKFEG